jgi:hypothetical protein
MRVQSSDQIEKRLERFRRSFLLDTARHLSEPIGLSE